MRESSFADSAARRVLTDPSYVAMITTFQNGLPRTLHDFAVQCHPDWNATPVGHRQQRLRLLGIEVIRKGSLTLLQQAARVRYSEIVGRQVVGRHIPLPIQHAIRSHRADMVRWIYENNYDPHARVADMWSDALECFEGNTSVLMVLKSLTPPNADTFADPSSQLSLTFSLLDIRLLQWVHGNLRDIQIPPRVMSEAASTGNLEVIRFLHENVRAQNCRSDIYCRAWSGGSLEVLEYLLKHRCEPCPDRFLKRVVDSGCTEVMAMVHLFRGDKGRIHRDSQYP